MKRVSRFKFASRAALGRAMPGLIALASLLSAIGIASADDGSCPGAFPDLIDDICYDCMFPMTLGGFSTNFGVTGSDYDTGASKSPVCICVNNLAVGTPISFWEPHYMVDTTATPGCMPLLGGVNISPPYNASEYGGIKNTNEHIAGTNRAAFMHVNEYINPVMSALGVVSSSPCLDNRSFDVPFMSWADPTWNDDSLSLMLTPYAYPFAGIASIAAEIPDAIAATVSFPLPELFWVAGAWGPMYPLNGNVASAGTPEAVAHLMVARIFAKLHAAGLQQSSAGDDALKACTAFGVPELIMDKRQYKTNRTYPFPDNQCTPIGRPLQFQEIGAARPQDSNYGYFVFQRKDCCAAYTVGP